jgi:hypothetical protein
MGFMLVSYVGMTAYQQWLEGLKGILGTVLLSSVVRAREFLLACVAILVNVAHTYRRAREMFMKLCIFLVLAVLSPGLVCSTQAQNSTASKATESTTIAKIDPKALEILKHMADYLAAAPVFSYRSESNYDVMQPSGVKVEFGASRRVVVARPNRLKSEVQRRDGLRGQVVLDGKTIWAYEPDENVYAQAQQPGGLDESLLFAVTELHIKAPLMDMLSADFYAEVTSNLEGAHDLGEKVVEGVICDHLLMRNDYTDFQLWIATGEKPLLKRVVITYREEAGEPQYRSRLLEWDLSPKQATDKIRFDPPQGAERIRFYVQEADKGLYQEGDS